MIKNVLLFAVSLFTLSACHFSNKEIKEVTTDADSVAINYFKGDGTIDSVITVKIIRDKNTINQLADLIADKNATTITNCGYDGSIHFFKNDSVTADIRFRMNDDNCMLFTFKQDGIIAATVLSPQAKQLLTSLEK